MRTNSGLISYISLELSRDQNFALEFVRYICRVTIIELYEIKQKSFKNCYVHKLFSVRKRQQRYLDLDYNMFDMAAISGYDVAQKNIKILHNPLMCWNISVIDDPLNDSFHLRNDLGVINIQIIFNVAPQKAVTCAEIRKIRRPSEFYVSGFWVSQRQNAVLEVLPQDNKIFLSPMKSRSVLHERHRSESRITLDNGNETISQNIHLLFSSNRAVNEFRTDYFMTELRTPHNHLLRIERLFDCRMRIFSRKNALI